MGEIAESTARIAIVSTPRCGNMWVRRLLASLCGLAELAADTPAELSWDLLPPRCVLQLHWPPTDELVSLLDRYSFKTLALARHPLDVLISILHFAQHESRTARWLNGAHGDERLLLGADPCSEAFRSYALGERAGALIDLSVHWWRSPRLDVSGRFEEIVDSPASELTRMADLLQLGPLLNAQEATATNSFESMQAQVTNQHFWQGQPGNWHRLISPGLAAEIAERHGPAFDEFGYEADADARLDPGAAAANWLALARPRQTTPPRTAIVDPRLRTHLDVAAIPAAGFVDQAYSLLLRRAADPDALKRAVTKLEDGTLSRARLLSELASSPEAEAVRELDDVLSFAAWARETGERPRSLSARAGTRESLIEIPWTLARATAHGPVLDVGCSFAESGYLTAVISAHPDELVGVDPATDPATPMRTVSADLRTLPFESAAFDLALAVSTIQRVGQDNRAFGLGVEHDPLGPLRALCELRRVLRHDGRLLVTVPCGEPQDLGWFVQHDPNGWRDLFAEADFFVREDEIYELQEDGWRANPDFSPAGVRWAERGPGASAILCAELRPGRIRYATRRAAAGTYRRLRGRPDPIIDARKR